MDEFIDSATSVSSLCINAQASEFCFYDGCDLEGGVRAALQSGQARSTVVLKASRSITVPRTITIKENDVDITIISDGYQTSPLPTGLASPSSSSALPRVSIVGNGHSVFQITGKRSRLTLIGLDIFHSMHDADKTKIGGVVFAMGSSSIKLLHCDLTSEFGFGAWCVQRSSCYLTSCRIKSISRSGCVAFGQSSLKLHTSEIHGCYQHGVCLRGNCGLRLNNCHIRDSGVRGIYAYESASVSLEQCVVSGTKSSHHGAIELRGVVSASTIAANTATTDIPQQTIIPIDTKRISKEKLQRKGKHLFALERGDQVTVTRLVGKRVLFENNAGPCIQAVGEVNIEMLDSMLYDPFSDACIQFEDKCPIPGSRHYKALHGGLHSVYHDNTNDDTNIYENSAVSECMTWYYQRNDDEWIQYLPAISMWLSQQYKRASATSDTETREIYFGNLSLPSPLDKYDVDLSKMVQRNKATFFERKIQFKYS